MTQPTISDDDSSYLLDWMERSANLGLFRHDAATACLQCSNHLQTLLELAPAAQITLESFAACFNEHQALTQAFGSPSPDTPLSLTRPGSQQADWLLHLLPRFDEAGQWTGHSGFIQCTRKLNELGTALRRQSAYLEAILVNLPQGITVFDENLCLRYWNVRAIEVLELPPETVHEQARFEDLIRVPAERGEYGPGDPQTLVEERRQLALGFNAHRFERTRPNGRTHLVAGEPMYIDGQIAGFITTYTDITERKAIELENERQRNVLKTIIDNIPCGVSLIDQNLQLVAYNEELKRVLDMPDCLFDQGGPTTLEDLLRFNARRGEYGPGNPEQITAELVERARHPHTHSFERTRPDGTVIHVRGQPVGDGSFVTIYNDVTELRRANERQLLADKVFQHTPDAVLILSPDKRVVSANPAFSDITGFDPREVQGKVFVVDERQTNAPDPDEAWLRAQARGCYTGECCGRRADGSSYPRELSLVAVRDASKGQTTHYIAIFTDITERKLQEAHIEHLAHHDALTGLANRYSLNDRLDLALAQARRNDKGLALLFLDLDRFKNVNDSLGHHAGDNLLIQVAHRLRSHIRDSDTVARLGGDEFVILLQDVDNARTAAQIASNLMKHLSKSYHLGDMELHAIPSIGISLFPEDAEDAQSLLRNADAAMYHAKAQGRGNFQFFNATLTVQAKERLRLESRLRHALDRKEFELWYQPLFELNNGQPALAGFEALVRWRNPDGSLVPPAEFIPLAEETGIIVPLGDWVIGEACQQLYTWQTEGHAVNRLAVNLSARQLRDGSLPEKVARLVRAYSFENGMLELEITESSVMAEPDKAIEILKALKSCGAALSIDDFGTGYSSLSYLKRFPLDRLKIDRSFVSDIETDANDAAIVAAAVSLAHSLGLQVVAEGVESLTQIDKLAALGCDELQGFGLGRPMPAPEVARFLASQNL